MKDHIYNTYLDLGVLGEQKVEVFYDWSAPRPTTDPFEVPETGGATVTAVMVWLDGKELDVYDYLNGDLISDLEHECADDYNAAV